MAAMKSTGEWTDETTIKLIEHYQTKKLLWDPKDDQYWKKEAKNEAWEELGKALGTTSDTCKNKMFSVLSSFRREKAKIKNSKGPGKDPSDAYKSQWFAFPALSFLLNRDNPRHRRNTESLEEIWIDADTPQSIQNEDILPPPKRKKPNEENNPRHRPNTESMEEIWIDADTPQSIKNEDILPPPKRKKPNEEKLDMMNVALGILKTATNIISPDDEISSFCSFIATKMIKYTDTTKNAVQKAMCDVIFKADQGYFEDEYLIGSK